MAIVSEEARLSCYDIKSADLSMVALLLKTTDIQAVSRALSEQCAESPGFFDHDPVIIDLTALDTREEGFFIDIPALMRVLTQHALVPLAVKGAEGAVWDQAKAAGLVDASDARIRRVVAVSELAPPDPTPSPSEAPVATPAPVVVPQGAMVVDKPLRSGQQVYAKGRDLVVMAMVNPGAEVISDGNIHIYATLRGKAIAGARGNTEARIFALAMEPELISIAGVYRTSENALPPEVLGRPAQVCLQSGPDGDKLLVTPLKP